MTNAVLSEKMVCVGLFDNGVCICTHRCSFLGLLFQAYSGLLVQGQRRSFEIGKDGGPAFFTKSFDRGLLCGFPSRREFLDLFSPFSCDCQFNTIAVSAADNLHETVPLQRPEIPQERRALHPKPVTQFSHAPGILGIQ